jgi:hypothetical protein
MSDLQKVIEQILIDSIKKSAEISFAELGVHVMSSAEDLAITIKSTKTLVTLRVKR